MHCGNTTFVYDNEFKDYMRVEGAVPEDIFDYLFDVGAGKFLSEKGKNISWNYLKNGTQSILSKLMKILMIIQIMMVWNIQLEMKACRISKMMTSLVIIKSS